MARSPAWGIFLWIMWSSRHYILPVIVLCHMLSFNCFLYLGVASILFFIFFSFISGYMAFHHIYIMNDSFDPGRNFWLLSCLCLRSLCPPLSEIAHFSLREVSSDYCCCCHFVPSIHISQFKFIWCPRTIYFEYLFVSKIVPWSPFASLSDCFLFSIKNITLPVPEKQFLSFPWFNSAHLDEL